ncbi:sigma-54 interaction domain-containing protein [Clostridium omnivorum]|uniref:Fis family transcriptional regulator n=1 Tax=Clostridium omnivorum TaxID=1604902 RepID=A0ABQ5N810_9CLOT|nr:sigma 54-interacting transcriptional regulator [Clostridium sp. E14]GLC31373.1 Fis family transcriptional regulator [Clostridium sp. E14]
MKRKVILITGTEGTRITLQEQLQNYIGNYADIESYAIDEGINKKLKADLVVISTDLIYEDAIKYIENICPIIVARRVINYSEIEKILFVTPGETILFVNDAKETTLECIEWLKKLGIRDYNFVPFYPGCKAIDRHIKIAVTPGEVEVVPKSVEKIINIGPRLIDITTLTEILKELNIFEEKWEEISVMYLNKIINMGKLLTQVIKDKTENYEHIIKVIDSVNEGLLAIDNHGIITVFNENLKYILGIRKGNTIGKQVKEVIKDKSLQKFIFEGSYKDNAVLEIKGNEYLVSRFSIKEENTKVIIFKSNSSIEDEINLKKELYKKGYYAKYRFEDIVGESKAINFTKDVAKKLAVSELNVLIEGESGTGKELFASSIHNASNRKDKPFVAVNFSALSENLVESELFGYEEGAFTGAAKGGKVGLFEQANGGTIFLDEIGDISPRVQASLLRVLQEKEIMKVGGNKITEIDVRVIAATNQNLRVLVEQGKFRADLYHRLKVLYLKLPALKERKEDILPLIRYFIYEKSKENLKIDEEVIKKLIDYSWNGNIRELKNTMEYMLTVCDNLCITTRDLPEESFFKENSERMPKYCEDETEIRGDFAFILKALYKINQEGSNGSRHKIYSLSKECGMKLSEQMIRNRLNELERMGYVKKKKGKAGTILTSVGLGKAKLLLYK